MPQDGLGAVGALPGDSGTGGPAARDGTGPGVGSCASHVSTPEPPWALALPRLQGGHLGQRTLTRALAPPGWRRHPTLPFPIQWRPSHFATESPMANMQKTLTLFMFWIINAAVKIPPVSFD